MALHQGQLFGFCNPIKTKTRPRMGCLEAKMPQNQSEHWKRVSTNTLLTVPSELSIWLKRNIGLCLRQQHIFAISWLSVVTQTEKSKVVNCFILKCLFQAICNSSYVQSIFMFTHVTGRPAGHFHLNALCMRSPTDFSPFTTHVAAPSIQFHHQRLMSEVLSCHYSHISIVSHRGSSKIPRRATVCSV